MAQIVVGGNVRHLTPRARRALWNTGASLEEVQGSGPNGRITEADILRFASQALVTTGQHRATPSRRAIAERTAKSSREIPHFFLQLEISAKALVRLRQQILEQYADEQAVRISLTDFFIAAAGRALSQMPEANVIWRDNGIDQLQQSNVGLVVRTDSGGLSIPVIKNLEKLNLFSVAKARCELVHNARQGRLSSQSEAAAISITNLGNSRVDSFTPLIDQSQSLMLAVGSVALRPWVDVRNQLIACETVKLCLAADHRVHDGVPAAQFLEIVATELENPARQFIRASAG